MTKNIITLALAGTILVFSAVITNAQTRATPAFPNDCTVSPAFPDHC